MIDIVENFVELVDITSIEQMEEYVNMVDISVDEDESFLLSSGIVSHNSAMGSILQKRDTRTDGVYRLKGKIKNVRSVSDLSSNQEVVELMQILDLDLDPTKRNFSYKRVIIATDADCIHGDEHVLTPNGPKLISTINIGDYVYCGNNNFEQVDEVVEREFEEFVIIELEGNPFKFAPYHPMIVLRNGEIIQIPAKDTKITDLFPKNMSTVGYILKNDGTHNENRMQNLPKKNKE